MSSQFGTKDEAIFFLEGVGLQTCLSEKVKAGLRKLTLDELTSFIEEAEEATNVVFRNGVEFGRRRSETEEDIVRMVGVTKADATIIRRYVERVSPAFIFQVRRSGYSKKASSLRVKFEAQVLKAFELLKDRKIAERDMVPE